MNVKRDPASPRAAATSTTAELEERLALIEVRLQQLFEHLGVTPRGGDGGGDVDPATDPEIQDLLAKGNTVQAVKRYHELTGASLDEAKAAIERAQAEG